jgi:hypothetical protein
LSVKKEQYQKESEDIDQLVKSVEKIWDKLDWCINLWWRIVERRVKKVSECFSELEGMGSEAKEWEEWSRCINSFTILQELGGDFVDSVC